MGSIINFDNVLNVRDFGGQVLPQDQNGVAQTGVIEGKLYRGAQISKMSDSDKAQFSEFGVSLVIDFRYASERQRQTSAFDDLFRPDVLELLPIHEPENEDGLAPHEAFVLHELSSVDDARRYMMHSYQDRPTNPAFVSLASRALKRMAVGGETIYVHCAAGKDRTGTFSALLLMLLGVSPDDVMGDYLRTREAVEFNLIKNMAAKRMEERYGRPYDPDALEPFFGVYPEFLINSLEVIGDAKTYAQSALGLTKQDIKRLQEHYS